MLRRLWRDGPLLTPSPWEMRTVRSLLARGLLRTRDRGRDRADAPGSWFLTARAVRLVSRATRTAPGAPSPETAVPGARADSDA